jgi:hypothetical protein
MSKPTIQPHVVLGLSEIQWNELERIAQAHACPSVGLLLQAVASGTLVVDWAWKWNYNERNVPGTHITIGGFDEDGRVPWA